MTIYHSFTEAGITYHLIDTLQPTDTITVGDVYLPLSSKEVNGGLCVFISCSDCKLKAICSASSDSTRLKTALKLAPNLLTNFPELGV